MLLTQAPYDPSPDSNLFTALTEIKVLSDDLGSHFQQSLGNGEFLDIIRLPGVASDRPVAALVPLDADSLDRIDAILRLWRALRGRPVAVDARVTRQQRRRLRHMLQAVDGYASGASHREIANAIFGKDRVAADPWKTSALRDATMDLVRDGLAMVAGGYRSLLRHRRRS